MKFLLFSLLIVQTIAIAQSKEGKIQWDQSKPLEWKDFKGQPKLDQNYVASTNSGISFSFSSSQKNGVKKVNYTIKSYFYPYLSWFMEGAVDEYILKHEQTHFDISELFARKLKKRLSELDIYDANYRKNMERIYQENERERSDYQAIFDWETNHSILQEEEAEWEEKITKELKEYDAWK